MPTTPTIPDGSKQMYINLYTGTGGSQSLINNSPSNPAGFQSGLQWFKSRSNATNNVLHDVLRGTNGINRLYSDSTAAEATTGDGFISINSNGFTLDGTGAGGDVNASTRTYVAWQWAAPSSGTTNTAGSITSSVAANTTAGFSVVTYTGNSTGATVGHGLGATPGMIIIKNRAAASNWRVWHSAFSSTTQNYLSLNLVNAIGSDATIWNNTAPTSSVFSVGNDSSVNTSPNTYVAYCWAPIAGYSAFGKYTGNNSTDGPFVYTGFRPRWIMIKADGGGTSWTMYDTARNTYNATINQLFANQTAAEGTAYSIDVLSNGFKIRSLTSNLNDSGVTMIYAAFAENPFKYANAR
jgi:hypothetical protein